MVTVQGRTRDSWTLPILNLPAGVMMLQKCIPVFLSVCCLVSAAADENDSGREEAVRRTTAVALNYCRAALHRIRRNPEKRIFYEEQTRILNNLDLNQIEDPEVIALYKSILDEISQVEISERERIVIREQFRRNIHRQLGTSFFVIGAQVVTGQLGSAVQSGANSWWDYRNQELRRDADSWKIERSEYTSLMSRSGTFLDSFWKLSQKNGIPDRWLIRDQDLDQLRRILAEREPAQRLRMLKRMERFMECYPPYWYYVARTQQQLGLTDEALQTFRKLSEIGSGHFRQDDMLASTMANMAVLQELQGDPEAPQTAIRVMEYSVRNWEANLVCAWVLGRHQKFLDAEELILCNLDEDQESRQSRVALASLYYHSENKTKLADLLTDSQVVRDVPIPGLLLSVRLLGAESVPEAARTYLASTLSATVRRSGRGRSVVLAAGSGWKLRDAQPEIASGSDRLNAGRILSSGAVDHVRFAAGSAFGDASDDAEIRVTLNYPKIPAIRITLYSESDGPSRGHGLSFSGVVRNPVAVLKGSETQYRIGSIEVEGVRLSFRETADTRVDDLQKDVSVENQSIRS